LRAVFCTQEQNAPVVDEFFLFRKKLFVDTLAWKLPVRRGREIDAFDTGSAVYCGLFRGSELIGGFRAIRTDEPYLARSIFPQLAVFAPYPSRPDVWEISRFGVLPSEAGSETARILYSLMFRFAFLARASALVALADLRYERFLRHLGIRTRRYGPPQVIGTDENGMPLCVVAGEISLGAQAGGRFEALVNLSNNMDTDDEALVFRPRRLSA
jgi:acyl homoserine lactone synthase